MRRRSRRAGEGREEREGRSALHGMGSTKVIKFD